MSSYVCSSCGYTSVSWYGKCPQCEEWNTFERNNFDETGRGKTVRKNIKQADFVPLDKTKAASLKRLTSDIYEFDRVLGGGFVQGEAILLSGEPGVGKSTLLLNLLSRFKTRYVSGEESAHQIKQRADRLKVNTSKIMFSSEIVVDSVIKSLAKDSDFDILVIDSIQTVYTLTSPSSVGSLTQVRESAAKLIDFAKSSNKILIIVGHVTKGGDIAGPKTLEHLVDCVLYLEGERHSSYRVLRSEKNRFGSTDEVGLFEMKSEGLHQVDNPTIFLSKKNVSTPGSVVVATIEGSRTIFLEIQSLVVKTSLPVPRRVVSGIDYNRLQLLLAVLRKYNGITFDTYDVYVNVVGGVSVKSPSADLGIVMAILSSLKEKALRSSSVCIGEIGLLGEVRYVYNEERAIKDALRLGFKNIMSSSAVSNVKMLKKHLKP